MLQGSIQLFIDQKTLAVDFSSINPGEHSYFFEELRELVAHRKEINVQIFGRSWPITVAASGVILVEDQIIGELFDGAEQRIAGNVVRQPWPSGKRKLLPDTSGQASCPSIPRRGCLASVSCREGYAGCLPTPFEVDAHQLYQEVKQRCPLLSGDWAGRVLDSRLLAGLPRRPRIGSKLRRSIPIVVLTAARPGQPIHRPSFVPRQRVRCSNGPRESTARFLPYSTSDPALKGVSQARGGVWRIRLGGLTPGFLPLPPNASRPQDEKRRSIWGSQAHLASLTGPRAIPHSGCSRL